MERSFMTKTAKCKPNCTLYLPGTLLLLIIDTSGQIPYRIRGSFTCPAVYNIRYPEISVIRLKTDYACI